MRAVGRPLGDTLALAVLLVLALTVAAGKAEAVDASAPKAVPTEACTCTAPVADGPQEALPFRAFASPVSNPNYDEQIGITFTQGFTSIEYNVTAVEQTDPTSGTGPAYLLDGLSNTGYWYQVGVSWNWAPGSTPGTGFAMSYEAFDSTGASVFPSNGYGGLSSFSGPVNAGDVILLNLYFSSAGSVVMLAEDTDTGASAMESYTSAGGTYFAGLPGSMSNANGFFTGLMTEWYHGAPYYANEEEAIYSNPGFALTSGWMWMDEFDVSNLSPVFSSSTSAPVAFTPPGELQEFSYNGTTEYSDAYEFVTGALGNGTHPTSTTVPLTLAFSLVGGAGYLPPSITYSSNGTITTAALSQTPTVYQVDVGTTWNVTEQLPGSNSSVRWELGGHPSGLAYSSETVTFVYYQQYSVQFGYVVHGAGGGYSPPAVNYTSLGSLQTTPAGATEWADAGSKFQYPDALPGSNDDQRWEGGLVGHVRAPGDVDAVYYLQDSVTFVLSFRNTTILPGLSLSSTSGGKALSATLTAGSNSEWLDEGAEYAVQVSYALASGSRLETSGESNGTVGTGLVVDLEYFHQLFVNITENAAGGVVTPDSGWYDAGSVITLSASASPGWEFEGWEGAGTDSLTSANSSLALTVGPDTQAVELSVFYPRVTISASGPAGVAYSDGSTSGTVPSGEALALYLPPDSELRLGTAGLGPLTSFDGWRGGVSSSASSVSLYVTGPVAVSASSSYDVAGIGAIVLIAVAVAVSAFVVLRGRRGREARGGEAAQPPSVQPASTILK